MTLLELYLSTDFLKCEFLKPCIYLLFCLLHLSCQTVYLMTEENHCFTLVAHYFNCVVINCYPTTTVNDFFPTLMYITIMIKRYTQTHQYTMCYSNKRGNGTIANVIVWRCFQLLSCQIQLGEWRGSRLCTTFLPNSYYLPLSCLSI